MTKPFAKLFIAIYLIVEVIQCMRIECEGHEDKDGVTDLWIQVCSLPFFVIVQKFKARRKATKTRVYLENAKYISSLLPFFAQLGRNKKGGGSHGFWLSLLSFFDMPNKRVTHFFSVSLALISLSA
jgi:hypothetical protein